jgi:hypothetical protein
VLRLKISPEGEYMMKKILLLTVSFLALAASQVRAQVSSTDRLAVSSGVSLWLSTWRSAKADPAKLQPLYGRNVVTHSAAAADQARKSWAEFANLIRDRSADFAAVITKQDEDPQVTIVQDRVVTSFSTGVRLVWEKTNGVWRIVEQSLPAALIARTAAD